MRSLIQECGTDQHCHCMKSLLKPPPKSETEEPVLEVASLSSDESLQKRLATPLIPLSIAERRLEKLPQLKLYQKRVDRTWHKRYNHTLPEDQQFDLQPYDEIQARDEEIAIEFYYGPNRPSWLFDNSKDSLDIRARILHRYNMEKRREEEARTEVCPTITHTRVESIISVNRTRAAQTAYLFGPSAAERAKTQPVITFICKLVRLRNRQKERLLHPIPDKSKWHFMNRPSTWVAIRKILDTEKKIQARRKFSRTIKVVRAVTRFIRVISIMSRDARHVLTEIHYFQENQRLQTALKIANKSQPNAPIASRDVFDPHKYRFSSRFKISPEIRMILTKPWNIRSDEEVSKVVDRLQELRCFVEYPVSFQHKLARLAWLIEVAADLAIIREGHIAADFYFMLAGKAKMIKLHGSPHLAQRGTFQLLRQIKNGDAFGDESMSHPDSERTYSVITTEKSVLLSLSSVDYVTMLLKTRDDEQAPEHIIFLSTLAFLQDFPKQKLIEEGDEYIRNYYLRAGSVISEALSESEYIYVVKYGSCRVLVEMVPPNVDMDKKRRSTMEVQNPNKLSLLPIPSPTLSDRDQHDIGVSRASSVLEFLQGHKDEIAKNSSAMSALNHMMTSQIDKEYKQTKDEAEKFRKKSKRLFRSLHHSTIEQTEGLQFATSSFSGIKTKRLIEEEGGMTAEGVCRVDSLEKSSGESFGFESSNTQSAEDLKNSTSSRHNVEKHLSFIVSNASNEKLPKVTKTNSGLTRHAVGTNIDLGLPMGSPRGQSLPGSAVASHSFIFSPPRESSKPKMSQAQSRSSMKLPKITRDGETSRRCSTLKFSRWKLIKTMVKGDYIGHEWVNLNRGPFDPPDEEMALVSDGCEVIMMHRDVLIKYLRKEL